jgi:hypothetical protein
MAAQKEKLEKIISDIEDVSTDIEEIQTASPLNAIQKSGMPAAVMQKHHWPPD